MSSKSLSAKTLIDSVGIPSRSLMCDHKVLGITSFCLLNSRKEQALIIAPDAYTAQELNDAIEELSYIAEKPFDIELYDEMAGYGKKINPAETRMSKMLMEVLKGKTTIVSSVESFVRKLPLPVHFESQCFELRVGDKINFDKFTQLLTEYDYDNECQISDPCEFAVRGGLIDVFSPIEEYPARIDFFGDEIESIRLFLPNTQKTFSKKDIYLLAPRYSEEEAGQQGIIADYFSQCPLVIMVYPHDCLQVLNEVSTEDGKFIFQDFADKARNKDKLFEIYRPFDSEIGV